MIGKADALLSAISDGLNAVSAASDMMSQEPRAENPYEGRGAGLKEYADSLKDAVDRVLSLQEMLEDSLTPELVESQFLSQLDQVADEVQQATGNARAAGALGSGAASQQAGGGSVIPGLPDSYQFSIPDESGHTAHIEWQLTNDNGTINLVDTAAVYNDERSYADPSATDHWTFLDVFRLSDISFAVVGRWGFEGLPRLTYWAVSIRLKTSFDSYQVLSIPPAPQGEIRFAVVPGEVHRWPYVYIPFPDKATAEQFVASYSAAHQANANAHGADVNADATLAGVQTKAAAVRVTLEAALANEPPVSRARPEAAPTQVQLQPAASRSSLSEAISGPAAGRTSVQTAAASEPSASAAAPETAPRQAPLGEEGLMGRSFSDGYSLGTRTYTFGESYQEVDRNLDHPLQVASWNSLPIATEYAGDDVRYFWVYLNSLPSVEVPLFFNLVFSSGFYHGSGNEGTPCADARSYIAFFFKSGLLFHISIRFHSTPACSSYVWVRRALFGSHAHADAMNVASGGTDIVLHQVDDYGVLEITRAGVANEQSSIWR